MNTEDFELRNRKSLINENNNIEQDTENLKNIYENKELNSEGFESDEERLLDDKLIEDIKNAVPQSKDELSFFNELLNKLPSKWKNYIIRTIFTLFMVLGFLAFIYIGPLALALVTIFVQVKCFQEIISVGYAVYKVHGLPWFRSLSWYFLVTSNYFFYGESFSKSDFFDVFLKNNKILYVLVKYHRFVSFSLYIIGILWFVLSLKKRYYMRQFSLFAWTHVTLLIVVTQSYLILQNLFQGLIWFIVPVSMIVINDVMAYLFGFFFGKTPLIKLSPKKTWEGFIGGGFSTIILGAILSHFLCKYSYLVCPVEYTFTNGFTDLECVPSHLFKLTQYEFPSSIASFLKIINMPQTITLYPFVLHSLALSTFSSLIAPFGGFFASGFKRAFKIKDFGDMIPGHGGIMDRFDCQFLMATFVNVYISSFISAPNPDRLLQQIYQLKLEHQIVIFEALKRTFEEHNLFN